MAESSDFDIGKNVNNREQPQMVYAVVIPRYMPRYSRKYYGSKYYPVSFVGDYPSWVERGSSMVECRTRNQVSPGSNPSLIPFRRLGIFVLSPVHSAV